MKVLIIVNARFGFDGISNVATNYYLYQDHNNVKMDFVLINEPNDILKKSTKKNRDKIFILNIRNKNPLLYIFRLYKIIKSEKYDIMHVHGNSCTMFFDLLPAKIAGTKVRIAHSHNTKCDHALIDKILRPFFKWVYTDGFACGEEAGKWLFRDKPFHIISNGVDLEKYSFNKGVRKSMRTQYGLDGKFVIGHVGRFSLQKNHRKLISIFEQVYTRNANAELILLGDGELRNETEDYCKSSKLPVRFIGNSTEVNRWCQAFDLIIFPSLFEGLPLFLIEAQAACLDCFISDTISPMTKITPLIHFISLNETSEKWAEKIHNSSLINRENSIEDIHNAIKSAQFDIRNNCKNEISLYNKLLNR